jgi:hypothetical protein
MLMLVVSITIPVLHAASQTSMAESASSAARAVDAKNAQNDPGKAVPEHDKNQDDAIASSRVEDWNTLKIPSNATFLAPIPPLKGTSPDFTREFLQLYWRPADPIDLYVMKPVGVEKPPVILYLYSFPSDTDRFKDNGFAKLATQNGFAAVGFVSALTGYRFHDRPMRQWFISELQEALGSSVHDVQLILNYLDKRGDLDMSRVGMFADGSGASIAIMAAAVDPRIRVLDLFNAWGDWPAWLAHSTLVPDEERVNYLKPEFLKKVENLDPIKWLPELRDRQIRLQYLNDNKVTPQVAKERMEAAIPPNTTIVHYESTKTFLKDVAYPGKTFDWVKDALRQTPLAQEKRAAKQSQVAPASKGSDR